MAEEVEGEIEIQDELCEAEIAKLEFEKEVHLALVDTLYDS